MEVAKLKEALRLLDKLEWANKQLDLLEKTQEFCSIAITGENGAEKQFSLTFSYASHGKELIDFLRGNIKAYLESQVKTYTELIEKL